MQHALIMLVQTTVGGLEQRISVCNTSNVIGCLRASLLLLLAWILCSFDDKLENWILACRTSEAFTITPSTDGGHVNFHSCRGN